MDSLSLHGIKQHIRGMSVQELAAVSRIMLPKLIAVAEAAQALMAEEGAREAVSQYNALFILEERLHSL